MGNDLIQYTIFGNDENVCPRVIQRSDSVPKELCEV